MTKGYEFMFILLFSAVVATNGDEKTATPAKKLEVSAADKARALFSPRLEYNEWMPVGRGDPLKNDPTFDYSPPVLDQVRYWAENNAKKDKNDILLLGVPSKKTTTTTKSNKEAKYGPIRRTFFTSSQVRQDLPTRLMPPPMPAPSSNQQPQYNWSHRKGPHGDSLAEPNIGFAHLQRPNVLSHSQQGFKVHQVSGSFADPSMFNRPHFEHRPTTITAATVPSTTIYQVTTKLPQRRPSLKQALQAEAAPFSIQPSNFIKEYSLSYYNPQVINSMELRATTSTTTPAPATTTYPITTTNPTTTTTAKVQTSAPTTTFLPTMAAKTTTEIMTTTTTPSAPSMTTDSLFSHYRQPNQPLRGPMYLIIQGHSKVKTYGLKNNGTDKHLPKIVPVRVNPVVQHVVNVDETGTEMTIQHIPPEKKPQLITETEPSAMDSLLSLLDTSFGNLLTEEEPDLGEQSNSLDSEKGGDFAKRNLQPDARPTTITTVIERSTQARPARRKRSTDPEVRETLVSSSYQVGDLRPYRKGVVVSEARPERVKLKTSR